MEVKKIAIFSALFGDYDTWKDPRFLHQEDNYDYFLFTDRNIKSQVYNVIEVNQIDNNAILTARKYKIYVGYKELCEMGYDIIIWHDANIIPRADIEPLYSKMVTDMMLMKHPVRDCIYDEFHACLEGGRDDRSKMFDQVQRYANNYYPENNGLVATGVMIRKNCPRVLKFCKTWVKEVENGSIRDQLSFNYVAWKLKFKFDMIPFKDTLSYHFSYNKHKNKYLHKTK